MPVSPSAGLQAPLASFAAPFLPASSVKRDRPLALQAAVTRRGRGGPPTLPVSSGGPPPVDQTPTASGTSGRSKQQPHEAVPAYIGTSCLLSRRRQSLAVRVKLDRGPRPFKQRFGSAIIIGAIYYFQKASIIASPGGAWKISLERTAARPGQGSRQGGSSAC